MQKSIDQQESRAKKKDKPDWYLVLYFFKRVNPNRKKKFLWAILSAYQLGKHTWQQKLTKLTNSMRRGENFYRY